MYQYNNVLPFNIKIPIKIRAYTLHLYISQFGYVTLNLPNFFKGTLVKYNKNKIKIKLYFEDNLTCYRMVIHNKVPYEYRSFVKCIGYIYTKSKNNVKTVLDDVFIHNGDYEQAIRPPPPGYDEVYSDIIL